MTTITIRHVPDETRNELAARAARNGQSLQEYMLRQITDLAEQADFQTLVAEVRESKRHMNSSVTAESILADRDADRR